MSMVISTNMSALSTTNQLNKNTTLMNSSLEKLSSGYSINSAADNSAGLAISEKMRSQIQGLDQASSNSQDAISLAQTADGALNETTSILERMRELAVQASSDTLTDDDRSSIQDETDQLRQEIDRISNDTEYNTKKLLNGDSGASTGVSGTNSAAINASATVAGNTTAAGKYEVSYTSVATQATTALTTASTSGITALTDSATAYAGDVSINGTTVTIEDGDTIDGVLKKINAETATTGVTAELDKTTAGNYFIKLTDDTYSSASKITLAADNATLTGLFNATTSTTATSVTTKGTDATGTINGAAATGDGNTLTAFDLTVTGDDTALAALTSTTAYKALATTANTTQTNLTSSITNAASTASENLATAITAATSSSALGTTALKNTVTSTYDAYTAALAAVTDFTTAGDVVTTKTALDNAISALVSNAGAANTTLDESLTDYNTAAGTAINTAAGAADDDATAYTTNGAAVGTAITAATTNTDEDTFATAVSTAADSAVTAAYTSYTDALTSGDAAMISSTKTDLTNAIGTSSVAGAATLQAALVTYNTNAGTAITNAATAATTADKALAVAGPDATVTVDTSSALTFQIGANTGQTMTVSINDMDANALGVNGTSTTTGIDLSTVASATDAITTIDAAIKKVSAERSNLGAVQNSLESNINNLDTESENLTSAESNIRDTDMAKEMAEYTKLSVVTQAATAMLAKANSQPQQVLTLLQ